MNETTLVIVNNGIMEYIKKVHSYNCTPQYQFKLTKKRRIHLDI